MPKLRPAPFSLLLLTTGLLAQETHNHPAPEKLGSVSFPISCSPSVQPPRVAEHSSVMSVVLVSSYMRK